MFEQGFKNIDDVLRRESGCTTELDYTGQTSGGEEIAHRSPQEIMDEIAALDA